ncbi:MAG: hypothetical protein ACKO40_09355 [Planctomycetaceae bacterium]
MPCRPVAFLCAAASCLALAGCQRIGDVSGTVRVDGKPVNGVIVVFDPGTKDAPRGVATTGGEGGYTIRRLGPGAKLGVPVGTYAVKVMADADNPNAPKIPPKYARGEALSCDVKPGTANVFDIEISTK